MYRAADLKTDLLHLWGWKQNYNVSDFTIAPSLTNSETDQYFQEVHPLVTLENVKSIAPDFENITHPAWAIGTQYYTGDRVTVSTVNYRAIRNNIGQTPVTSPDDWEPFDAFSEWLEGKTQGSILKAIRTFWDEKMVEKTAKNMLEDKALFDGAGRLADVIENDEKLVGFEIVPIRANGITTKINKIGLQFTEAGQVTMYLMHSSREGIVKTIQLTRTRVNGMEWFTPTEELYLPYVSSENDSGGSWYLVYKQVDLPGTSQAINKTKDWSASPCNTCNGSEVAAWKVWSKYLEIHPFKISNPATPLTLWDIEDNMYTYDSNYGINLQISIECDITDIIIQQRKAFQNIIGLQVAVDMIREFAYNPNFNIGREQQNFSRMELLYELDGDSQGYKKSGLVNDLNNAMKAVKLDTTNMSRVCFPCGNRGVKFKTV